MEKRASITSTRSALPARSLVHRPEIRDGAGLIRIATREVKAGRNAAGTGALMALLNRDHRREIEQTVKKSRRSRGAGAAFPAAVHRAMALPNKVDPFPKLAAAVTLPPRKMDSEGSLAGEGRRAGFARERAPAAITVKLIVCKCFRQVTVGPEKGPLAAIIRLRLATI